MSAELLQKVEAELKDSATPPATFGREALGDPAFVRSLRAGRKVGAKLAAKVEAHIANEQRNRKTEAWASRAVRSDAHG